MNSLNIDEIPTIEATRKRRIDKLIIHCSAVGPRQTSSARQIDAWHRAKGWQMIGYHYVIRRDGNIEVGRPADMIGAHTSGQNSYSLGICYEGGLAASPQAASPRPSPKEREVVDSRAVGIVESVGKVDEVERVENINQQHQLPPTPSPNTLSQSPPLGGGREGPLLPADTRTPQQKATLLALLKHLKTLYPNATIHGHNEFARKACPCFSPGAEYTELLHTEND